MAETEANRSPPKASLCVDSSAAGSGLCTAKDSRQHVGGLGFRSKAEPSAAAWERSSGLRPVKPDGPQTANTQLWPDNAPLQGPASAQQPQLSASQGDKVRI